jgi:hypothetical protein
MSSKEYKYSYFRPFIDSKSDSLRSNIDSNWKIIAGGLKNHTSEDHINLYGITHMIRQIDDFSYFRVTKNVFELCNMYKIEIPSFNVNNKEEFRLDKKNRQRINKLINKIEGITDSVQIEHLNGGVKGVVKKLIDSEAKDWESLKKIHLEHTFCCCKLVIADRKINHYSDLKSIDIK